MEDSGIIELYWQRDENAINESDNKYGPYCSTIARNIIHSEEDTEECVNDTWMRAWNAMPPERPNRLAVFFGRITRNLAIDRYRREKSQKYGGGQVKLCLDELTECVGDGSSMDDRIALRELINTFLHELPEKNCEIFLCRYWYMMPVNVIAKRCGMTEGAVKMTLSRVRSRMKEYFEKEGII